MELSNKSFPCMPHIKHELGQAKVSREVNKRSHRQRCWPRLWVESLSVIGCMNRAAAQDS